MVVVVVVVWFCLRDNWEGYGGGGGMRGEVGFF